MNMHAIGRMTRLGLLVLAVGLRFAVGLILKPDDLFSIRLLEGE